MDYTEKTVTFLKKRILRFTWSISGKTEDSIVKSEISAKLVLTCVHFQFISSQKVISHINARKVLKSNQGDRVIALKGRPGSITLQ